MGLLEKLNKTDIEKEFFKWAREIESKFVNFLLNADM